MSFLDKFKDQFVDHDEEDDDLDDEEMDTEEPQRPVSRPSAPVPPAHMAGRAAPSLRQAKPYTMVVVAPKSYGDAEKIADHLKADRPVVMNLEKTDVDEAQRIVDFVQGIMYALDGRISQIAESIYLCAPHNVSVSLENYTPYQASEENRTQAPQWNPQAASAQDVPAQPADKKDTEAQ